MKTILSLKKHQVIIITILVVFFAFSANTVHAMILEPLKIEEPTIIKEVEPIKSPEFIPIGKAPHVEYPVINISKPIKITPIDLSIDRLFNEKFSVNKTTNIPNDCITPTAGMEITENTTLCPGEHVFSGTSPAFISIKTNNVTLDCDGAILSVVNNSGGQPAIAVTSNGGINSNNITVKNCIINNFYHPIIAGNTDYTTLSNITYDKGAIWIYDYNNGDVSYLNKPLGSDGSNSLASLHVTNSDYNNFHHNTIYSSYGISLLSGSSFNLIYNNSLGYLSDTASYPASFYLGQGANNNEFYDNEIIENIDSGLYGIIIYGENNPTYGNTIENKIYNNTFYNDYVSIFLSDSAANNEIYGNSIVGSDWNGILMWPYETTSYGWKAPHDNNIRDNYFSDGFRDIVITNQVNDNIFDNNTFNNTSDIAMFMYRNSSPSSKAIGNEFINNHIIGTGNTGIEIHNDASQNSYFEGNHIKNRTNAGIIIGSGNDGSYLLLNNFVDNTIQVIDHSDNTYDHIAGGNFWSDFDEPDEGCNDINIDGKCDEDYYGIMGTGGNIDSQPFTGAPTLEPIENISINELNNAIINMKAEDPQGDELTYSVDDERFRSMAPCWPGKQAFLWTPDEYGAGTYTVNTTITDGVHEVSYPVSVNVANTCQINKWGKMVCTSYFEHLACY